MPTGGFAVAGNPSDTTLGIAAGGTTFDTTAFNNYITSTSSTGGSHTHSMPMPNINWGTPVIMPSVQPLGNSPLPQEPQRTDGTASRDLATRIQEILSKD